MKTPKSDQLSQNIKSTCQKLKEATDKPYTRPGKGEEKVFNSLADLKGLSTRGSIITDKTSTSTAIWKDGYVTDNFQSYYLDENMVKHYHK